MKQRLLSVGLVTVLAFGGTAAVAAGDPGDNPGPNGENNKGLCTAFFNGQKNGHNNDNAGNENGNGRQPGEQPPPFQSLSEMAGEAGVYDFCEGLIGGNPEENGRYPECFDDNDETTNGENNACPGEDSGA